MDREKLGYQLRNIRKSKGYSLRQVEKLTAINRGFLSKLERGELKNIDLQKVMKLAECYEVDICSILSSDQNWKNSLTENMKKFVNPDNIAYLELGLAAKEKGIAVGDAKKIINIYSHLASAAKPEK